MEGHLNSKPNQSALKMKLLIAVLVLAIGLDIAGMVFFFLYMGNQSKLKGIKKERDVLTSNINQMGNINAFKQGELGEKGAPEREYFVAEIDGAESLYALSPPMIPQAKEHSYLMLYFHGMGSTYMEPYMAPVDKPIAHALRERLQSATFLSVDYRGKTSWLNDKALADTNQNVRAVLNRYPTEKIIVVGTSMGGASALAYSFLAAPDIKEKIVGVIACEAAGDLAELFKTTNSKIVQAGLAEALGLPEQNQAYKRHSLFERLKDSEGKEGLKKIRFAVLSANQDDVVPVKMQKDIVAALQKEGIASELISFDEKHGVPPSSQYLKGLEYILSAGPIKPGTN